MRSNHRTHLPKDGWQGSRGKGDFPQQYTKQYPKWSCPSLGMRPGDAGQPLSSWGQGPRASPVPETEAKSAALCPFSTKPSFMSGQVQSHFTSLSGNQEVSRTLGLGKAPESLVHAGPISILTTGNEFPSDTQGSGPR